MRDRKTVVFLIALLAVMTFIPLLSSWYTTNDDVYFALGVGEGWRSPWVFDARRSGRLQQAFTGQLMPIAYGWGWYGLTKAISLATILSNVAALFVLVRTLTGDVRLGLLAVTFFFAFVPNTWDSNLLTAYPFIIGGAFTLFLLSVAAWWRALQGARRMAAVSAALFAVGLLTYEIFMPYVIVYPLLALAATEGPWRGRIGRALRTPHLPMFAVFLVLLVLFRVFFYTTEGEAFNAAQQYEINLEPAAVAKVLERYGAAALPMHYFRAYRDLIKDYYLGYGSFQSRFFEIFEVLDAAWLVKAAIVAFLTALLTSPSTPVRRRGLLVCFGLILLVLTNLPLAVTTKYQVWAGQYFSHGYLTAYLVFFGVVVLLTLAVEGAAAAAAGFHRGWGRLVVGAVAVTAFVVSYGTDFLNAHVAASQRQVRDRWAAVDAWMASPAFQALPEDSLVFAPSLWDRYPGSTVVNDDYWPRYVKSVGKKRLRLLRLREDWDREASAGAAENRYFLRVIQEPRRESAFLLFGPVMSRGAAATLRTNEITFLAHARSDHFRLVGRLLDVDSRCRARMVVDGVPSSGTFDESFGAHVDRARNASDWLSAHVTSEGGLIDPESVMISESSASVDGALDLVFGRGFYPPEASQLWAENEAELAVRNRSNRDMSVDLLFAVRSPAAAPGVGYRLEAMTGTSRESWQLDADYHDRSIRLQLPPESAVTVTFHTDAPRLDPSLDPRTLVMMFQPTVQAREVWCGEPAAGHQRR